MKTSARVLGIVLALLLLAARGGADEAEDRAERYLREFAQRNQAPIQVIREADDDPVRMR